MIVEVDSTTFDKEVFQADRPVLVDFWAPWCGPCRMLGGEIDKLEKKHSADIKIVKVNADRNTKLCIDYSVMSIPTMLIVKNGEVKLKATGVTTEKNLEEYLVKYAGMNIQEITEITEITEVTDASEKQEPAAAVRDAARL